MQDERPTTSEAPERPFRGSRIGPRMVAIDDLRPHPLNRIEFACESSGESNSSVRVVEKIAELKGLSESAAADGSVDTAKMMRIILELGDSGDGRAKSVLREYMGQGPIRRPRSVEGASQVALVKLGDEQAYQEVLEELHSEDPFIVSEAFAKLGMIGDKRAIRVLGSYLNDSSVPERRSGPIGQSG